MSPVSSVLVIFLVSCAAMSTGCQDAQSEASRRAVARDEAVFSSAVPSSDATASKGLERRLSRPPVLTQAQASASPARLSTTESWSEAGTVPNGNFGVAASAAGDVNGDGFADVVIGAQGSFNVPGKVYAFMGSANGLSTLPVWSASNNITSTDYFGNAVAYAGDVNGDGYGDVVVGAYGVALENVGYSGKAVVYLGSASGLGSAPAWTVTGESGSYYGHSVASAGDVNGDGYADIVVGAERGVNNLGAAYVYYGSRTGPSNNPDVALIGTGNGFGTSVRSAGDVNGDGFSDVLVGAPGDNVVGRVYLYMGSSAGLSKTPARTLNGELENSEFGYSAGSAGDVNGDGYSDVVVGAPRYSAAKGKGYLFLGSSAGLAETASWTRTGATDGTYLGIVTGTVGDLNADGYGEFAVASFVANSYAGDVQVFFGASTGPGATPEWSDKGETSSNYGVAVASAGDVNGDGVGDLLVGANGYASQNGKAYLYYGLTSTLDDSPVTSLAGINAGDYLGASLAMAGDVNGDGLGDFLVGTVGTDNATGSASLYLGSRAGADGVPAWAISGSAEGDLLGAQVAGAGDVDGDGYSDVLVSAIGALGGVGKVSLYRGSNYGLSYSAAWTQEGSTVGEKLGFSVAGAGDVNGDGYGDVVTSAPGVGSGEAFFFAGGEDGLETRSTWSQIGETYGDAFGTAVAGVGDVNGDGFADIAVGADAAAGGRGRVYLFLGSPAGPARVASWTGTGAQTGDGLGASVAGAGDVNGDGFADFVVGAPDSAAQKGKVFLYLGSASGPLDVAISAQGDTAGSLFGASVASAGDVNGDGFGDVFVGAYGAGAGSGAAYLFLGSKGGSGAVFNWTVNGTAGSRLGTTLAGGGDLNGDGYGDVLIGSPSRSESRGGVDVYLGNTGDGILPWGGVSPETLAPDLNRRLFTWGRSISPTSFASSVARGRAWMGRQKVRLQVEARARGTAFNGQSLVASPWIDSTVAGTYLATNVMELSPQTDYHWRARVQYHPSSGIPLGWSQWYYGGTSGDAQGVHVRTDCSADVDGDGLCDGRDLDSDNDGDPDTTDCAPFDAQTSHTAAEQCNGLDDNCDGRIDDGVTIRYYPDADHDGFGQSDGAPESACSAPPETAANNTDCADDDGDVYPGAVEQCNGQDDDCDGVIDDGLTTTVYYPDDDSDGYGGAVGLASCVKLAGYVTDNTDCNDDDPRVHPGASEVCNLTDDNCNEVLDEGVQTTFYPDSDGDGFGDSTHSTSACLAPNGYVAVGTDCDDHDSKVNPDAEEVCNGKDDNCNTLADEDLVFKNYYADIDEDGFGNPTSYIHTCEKPVGYVTGNSDCNDRDADVHPGADETPDDGIDSNCDGQDPTSETPTPAGDDATGCSCAQEGGRGSAPGNVGLMGLGMGLGMGLLFRRRRQSGRSGRFPA